MGLAQFRIENVRPLRGALVLRCVVRDGVRPGLEEDPVALPPGGDDRHRNLHRQRLEHAGQRSRLRRCPEVREKRGGTPSRVQDRLLGHALKSVRDEFGVVGLFSGGQTRFGRAFGADGLAGSGRTYPWSTHACTFAFTRILGYRTSMLTPIETRPYLSDSEFRASYLRQKPIRLTGMTARWPALGWTFASLAERAGDTAIELKHYLPREGADFFAETTQRRHPTTLGEWLRMIERDTTIEDEPVARWCLRESTAPFEACPGLAFDLDFRGLFPRGHKFFRHYLWAGPAGYVTGLHTDEIAVNLLAHLLGRKRIALYPPESESHFGTTTRGAVDGGRYSSMNPMDLRDDGPDGWVAELEPGDLLYIPEGHWHWAVAHTACLSVTGASETA